MNTLCGTTSMCCACEPRLPTLKTPQMQHRAQPTGPQYFTFDSLPEVRTSPIYKKSSRIKKRSRRVLYPPVVKRYYPAEERSFAKRLLFILLAIVFFQIYSAEEELPVAAAESLYGRSLVATKEPRCEAFPLQEEPSAATHPLEAANATGSPWPWANRDSPGSTVLDITQFLQQSRRAAF